VNDAESRVLIPALGSGTPSMLLDIANCLLRCYGGSATVLSVVQVPEGRSLSEGALVVRRKRALVRKIAQSQGGGGIHTDVRTAHSLEGGIRESVARTEASLLLLNWNATRRPASLSALESLAGDPPCDLAVVKRGDTDGVTTVLVPARGGPQARLALHLAEAIAKEKGAVLTLLHVNVSHWNTRRRAREERFFQAILGQVRYENVRHLQIDGDSAEAVLLDEGTRHDMVVMGAAARDETSPYVFGRLPTSIARSLPGYVVIVKTREPVTRNTFKSSAESSSTPDQSDLSEVVDRWFAENTFHSHEFRTLRHLVELKEAQGKTISLALPTLNEEKTVGKIITTIKRQLVERFPLIDEIVVIDSDSDDRTVEIVEALGIRVYKHPDILPQYGSYPGKGEALWKSLYVTKGDIIVWIDSDITGIHPKFVYGLIGPLLTQPNLGFVKGFYRRPLNLGGQMLTTGGGRVTELTARPLINLFYPQLSGLVQPLAGEMAGHRAVLEAVPFFTGYGVETGLLIDILDEFGLHVIAQTDLEERVHRNQSLLSLSKMANAIVQVVIKRLGDRNRLSLLEDVNTSMKLIHYAPTELFLEVKEIRENERPPIKTLSEYVGK